MHSDIKEITYTADEIRNRVVSLAKQLEADYSDKNPIFIGILKGSFMFLADLVRCCDFPLEIKFMSASSYKNAVVTSGDVMLSKFEELDIAGRHVVIIEDILDSGYTLHQIREMLARHSPASLRICAFLNKAECRKVEIEADYAGFVCPAEFLVGYGLDYADCYRNLPYIGILKPEIYST